MYGHDEINLARLLRRLEKSAAPQEWKDADKKQDMWLKAEAVLQRVKFARKLLRNCESFEDVDEKKSNLFKHWKGKLDGVETAVGQIRDRVRPKPTRPPPILSFLPVPVAVIEVAKPVNGDSLTDDQQFEPPEKPAPAKKAQPESLALPAEQLLLSPSDTTPLPTANLLSARPSLIPPNFVPNSARSPETAAVATGASRFLHNSNALHQDLSEQLAQMAVQLKRNTLHFSEMLEKDKAIVEETQQKLEGNFDVMQKERIRLRDHRGKSGSTTCLVVAIILAVVLLFVMMVFLIRLSRTI